MPMPLRDSSLLVLLVALAPACGFFGLHGDPVVASVACVDGRPALESLVAEQTLVGSLSADDPDTIASTCGGEGRSDRAYQLVPPQVGTYDIRLQSDFDAVLYVVTEPCDDPSVLECADESIAGASESLAVELEANVPYVVVVDAFTAADVGSFSLLATWAGGGGDGCAGVEQTLETSLGVDRYVGSISGTTIDRPDLFTTSCSGSTGFDDAWRFVPPVPGVYRITLTTYETPGSVGVRDASCTELVCDDGAASSGSPYSPVLEVMLSAGTYDLVVSGTGAYALAVEQVLESEVSPTCQQPCSTAAECDPDERCLPTTTGQVCLPSLCETCFAQDMTCWSLPYTCGGLACS